MTVTRGNGYVDDMPSMTTTALMFENMAPFNPFDNINITNIKKVPAFFQ